MEAQFMTNQEYIEELVKNVDKVYLDTSSLMNDGFEAFIKKIEKPLIRTNKKLTIPHDVHLELIRHQRYGDS